MLLQTPTIVDAAPAEPTRAMSQSVFSAAADLFVAWFVRLRAFLALLVPWMDEAITEVAANTLICQGAALTIGANVWVSGTTYAIGDPVYSPINYQTYRRKTVGGGVTDPSADSTNWTLVVQAVEGAGASTTAASAVDITLTLTSSRVQRVAMTVAGKSVYMADARTVKTGGPLHVLINDGVYSFAARDSAGTLLAVVDPGCVTVLYLSDISTAAGVWRAASQQYNGQPLSDIILASASVLNAVASTFTAIVMLSSVQALCSYVSGGDTKFVALDISGTTITAGAIFGSGVNSQMVLVRLSATTALAVYPGVSNYLNAFVVTVTGNTCTKGTTAVALSGALAVDNVAAAYLSAGLVFVAYRATGTTFLNSVCLSISGTTVTAGAVKTINGAASVDNAVVALSATRVAIASSTSGATAAVLCYIADIAGTTITNGVASGAILANGTHIQIAATAVDAFFIAFYSTTAAYQGACAVAYSVSGTVATPVTNAPKVLDPLGNTPQYKYSLTQLSATKFLLMHRVFGFGVKVLTLQIQGPEIVVGRAVRFPGVIDSTHPVVAALGANKAVGLYAASTTFANAQVIEVAQ